MATQRLSQRAFRPAAAFALLSLAHASAHALTTRCVHNVTELDAAVRLSEDDEVRINLIQGEYLLNGTVLTSNDYEDWGNAVTMVGGYTDSGCTQRDQDPAATILRGNPQIILSIGSFNHQIPVTLRSLTAREFLYQTLYGAGHTVDLERVVVRDSGYTVVEARHFRMRTSLIADIAPPGATAGALQVRTRAYVESLRIENSLITGSSGAGLEISGNSTNTLYDWGNGTIENSILWGNAGADLTGENEANRIALRNNIIGTQDLVPISPIAPVYTLTGDPLFVNAAAGNWRLQDNSPARNTGTAELSSGLPALDIAGLPRVVAGTIDRGPHENQTAVAQFLYTVTNTLDTGAGSLRQALLDAEASPGLNAINFNIPGGGCPKLISVFSPLPSITEDLNIDGWSQPGNVIGTAELRFDALPCIALRSTSGLSPDRGLVVGDSAPADATLLVRGLAFSGFGEAGIDLRGGGNHRIEGNQFAGTINSFLVQSNGSAVRVTRVATPTLSGVQVGGSDARQRNLLGGSDIAGITLNGSFVRDTQVRNNFIGLAANGSNAEPNLFGVLNTGAVDTTLVDNWISGNESDGVFLNTSHSFLQDNHIGLRAIEEGGVLDQGNGGHGLRLQYSGSGLAGNVAGSGVTTIFGQPAAVGTGNSIAYNSAGGIRAELGLGHRFSRNLVHDNAQPEIDIGAAGHSANDNDSASGASGLSNRGLNAPELASVSGGGNGGTARGLLRSRNGSYRIELYSMPFCASDPAVASAHAFHAAFVVTINNATSGQDGVGNFAFDFGPNATVLPPGRGFTALAIDVDGNTSELGTCVGYTAAASLFANGFESP